MPGKTRGVAPKLICDKHGIERTEYLSKGELKRHCTKCHAEKERARRNKVENIDKCRRACRNTALKRKYGLTIEQKDQMILIRHGACDMCGEPPKAGKRKEDGSLNIDHDHDTGKIRGMLCGLCNRNLGLYEKIKKQAEVYLDQNFGTLLDDGLEPIDETLYALARACENIYDFAKAVVTWETETKNKPVTKNTSNEEHAHTLKLAIICYRAKYDKSGSISIRELMKAIRAARQDCSWED